MSTSPSWFDQEKFSRLVKKVGPKQGAEPTASIPHVTPTAGSTTESAMEAAPESAEPLAPTARISLVSRPPSLLHENRALPALPRRTAPLPGLKSIFKYPTTPEPETEEAKPEVKTAPPPPIEAKETKPLAHKPPPPVFETKVDSKPEPKFEFKTESKVETKPESKPMFDFKPKIEAPKIEPKVEPKVEPKPEPVLDPESMFEPELGPMGLGSEDDLDAIWQKMALLNEELAQTIRERDQAFHDNSVLRDQLEITEVALEAKGSAAGQGEALQALTEERDQARKEYVDLRKQFETLKREREQGQGQGPGPREESIKFRKELEQQLDGFRQKLEEKNKEIAALKAAASAMPVPAVNSTNSASSAEVAELRSQLAKAREEVSISQRGLALSQKALQETRMTLREATEGTSLSRHNFDNLKAECATLTQQNTVLQAQNDQLSRELGAAKSKLTTRL